MLLAFCPNVFNFSLASPFDVLPIILFFKPRNQKQPHINGELNIYVISSRIFCTRTQGSQMEPKSKDQVIFVDIVPVSDCTMALYTVVQRTSARIIPIIIIPLYLLFLYGGNNRKAGLSRKAFDREFPVITLLK